MVHIQINLILSPVHSIENTVDYLDENGTLELEMELLYQQMVVVQKMVDLKVEQLDEVVLILGNQFGTFSNKVHFYEEITTN